MGIKLASGRNPYSDPLFEQAIPFALDPAAYQGSWVLGDDKNMYFSDGEQWQPAYTLGAESWIPPWVDVPYKWFQVNATIPGDLSNRIVIANKFDLQYIVTDVETWPVITPAGMFSDSAGTIPVLAAPEPVGLIEDTTVPQINWYQDVTASRPTWKQLTRNGETVDYLEFDLLGQEMKVDFASPVTGTMVHVTSNGIYRVDVEIPVGTYNFGRYQRWPIEEIILLNRVLTDEEYDELKAELIRVRNRAEDNFGTNWSSTFRNRTDITEMKTEFDFTGATALTDMFRGNNAGEWLPKLPNDGADFFKNANSFTNSLRNLFAYGNITSLPSRLMENFTSVTNSGGTASGGVNGPFADNDITEIPEGFLDAMVSLTDVRSFFYSNQITSIPENLFANCPNITILGDRYNSGCFAINQIASIPENLFSNLPNLASAFGAFYSNALTSIPENLFANNPNLTTVGDCFASNGSLTSIPENLFANNPNLVNAGGYTGSALGGLFSRCYGITSIPENLFANNPNITNFGNTFVDCQSVPSLPENLFANNPNVTSFFQTFYDCHNLTSIPENLFANNPNVTTFSRTFFRCYPVTVLPANLFANNPNVTSFYQTFYQCGVTSVPAGLFDNQTVCTDYNGVFRDCALDQTSVDNVLVSVLASANANSLDNGTLGIDGGTNATPSVGTGQPAADALRARGWTVNLNGY